MSATLQFPNGTRATLSDDGIWACEDPDFLRLIREIAKPLYARTYLPDPYEQQREGVAKALGGTVRVTSTFGSLLTRPTSLPLFRSP